MAHVDKEQFAGKRIAVLAGGNTGEREVSLRSGRGVYEALVRQGLDAVMVDPTADLVHQLAEVGADLVYNALHGGAGEDGTIQALLDLAEIPYTGPGVLASALTMHKLQTKRILQAVSLPTPAYAAIETPPDADTLESIIQSLGLPVVTKPISEGSSLGITICRDRETLESEIQALLECYGELFVEAFIPGIELTVGVLGSGAGAYALPVLEIAPKREFYDYEAKYIKGLTDLICPARISDGPPAGRSRWRWKHIAFSAARVSAAVTW